MRPTYVLKLIKIALCATFLFSIHSFGQVGINTTSPNGILDINSTNTGFVLPRVSLTASNVSAPVTNPQGGAIPAGTMVFNTNTTFNGTNDVSPGIYVWDGSNWKIQFARKQSELFESSLYILARSSGGFRDIAGLTADSFTADYTGTYRVEVSVNYGGGGARVPDGSSQGTLNIARQSCMFRLDFDGTDYDLPMHSYSTAYNGSIGATNYFAIWQEQSMVMYINLTAGDSVSFTLQYDQEDAPEFVSNGDSGSGRGYIAYDLPCTVEITYMGN